MDMKIALVCSSGGHLTEMLLLMEAFEGYDPFFITYKNSVTEQLNYRKYLTPNIGTNMWKMIKTFYQTFKILRKEKPDLIVSTGSEIAIPSCILAKFMGIKTIYIESWCRVKTKSGTGRLVYYFSDVFLVQWPDLARKYGKKASYKGAVI
jgi:UDP-N-acetylglucosamine:LPS N-acetylglucosamine transferase